jgi:hypothetical protein
MQKIVPSSNFLNVGVGGVDYRRLAEDYDKLGLSSQGYVVKYKNQRK